MSAPGYPRIGRLSLQIGAAVALGMAVAALMALALTSLAFSRDLDASLRKEMGKLMPAGAPRDVGAVSIRVVRRAATRSTSMKIALVYDPAGHQIVGRVLLALQPDGFVTLMYRDGDSKPKKGRVYTLRLPDGGHISIIHHDEMGEVIRHVLPMLLVCLMLAGALFGVLASRIMAHTIASRLAITRAAADAIAEGDLSQRIGLDGVEGIFADQAISLNRMIARMEDMLLAQRHFASHLAHELRTPLTRLRTLLGHEAGADPAEQARLRAEAMRECGSIIAIFEALLRLSEIEAGQHPAAMVTQDLALLIEDAIDTMEPVLAEAGCALDTGQLAPTPIVGDRRLLLQLFVNLLENIALHTRPGTLTRIRLEIEEASARVTIADNGPGLDAGQLARVTRPFERGGAAGQPRGSGLGLAVARAIMRFHHGELHLRDAQPGLLVELRFALAAAQG